jgi:geranylgeranyl diphosphate synthase type II
VLLSAAAHGGNWQQALAVAAAIELFQNWVLIHDDIEDGSDERRGRPALHHLVGVPVAINVGDALHVCMWRLLHSDACLALPRWREVIREFEAMILRTAEGQHLDLSWVAVERFDVSEAEYLTMVTLKTAYYTVIGPLRLGALCAGLTPDPRLNALGRHLGMAFQLRDDVLNLLPEATTGKEFAGDLYEGKRTLILAHLLTRADEAEKAAIIARLAQPRRDKRDPDVRFILSAIARHGSLAYAQRVAEVEAERGLALLSELAPTLADPAAAAELMGLLKSLARRLH